MSSVPQEVSEFVKEKYLVFTITTDSFFIQIILFKEQIVPEQLNFFL